MGRMHLQRALSHRNGPHRVLATEVDEGRRQDLLASFQDLAQKHDVEFTAGVGGSRYDEFMPDFQEDRGIDDVEVMAAVPEVVLDAVQHVAPGGVINIFAGMNRGTMLELDAWSLYGPQQIRIIGHSGSGLDDQVAIVERIKDGEIQSERSVAAIGGLFQIPDAIRATEAKTYSGKVVVFPNVLDFPCTGLADLKDVLPEVYAKLENGQTWTMEAEQAFLEINLRGGTGQTP